MTRNILLIEDDPNKINQLMSFLESNNIELPHFQVTVKKSYQSGIEAILSSRFDLILLDMSMHNFDKDINEAGGEFMQFAGEDILKEMVWNGIDCPVIIVTQYDLIGNKSLSVLRKEWEDHFSEIYLGSVFYSPNELNWKKELLDIMKKKLQ